MKKLSVIAIISLALLSCNTLSTRKANLWLDSKRGTPAKFDISGKWDAGFYMGGGWGVGHFYQQGNRFRGTLSAYSVKGIVSGENVYMLIKGGNTLYTAKLELRKNGSLFGEAVYQDIVDSNKVSNANSYPISMKRMN